MQNSYQTMKAKSLRFDSVRYAQSFAYPNNLEDIFIEFQNAGDLLLNLAAKKKNSFYNFANKEDEFHHRVVQRIGLEYF